MRPLPIVVLKPVVELLLQTTHVGVGLLPEYDLVKIAQDGFVEVLADPVCLQ